MSIKNQGYNIHRLSDPTNKNEKLFAKAWDEHLERGALRQILVKKYSEGLSDEEIKVSATIVQWLGSNCGTWFLRDFFKDNPEIAKLVFSKD